MLFLAAAVSTAVITVGEPSAVVNAPVAPDAIYVARAGGLSVVDLNGFGQSTGSPAYSVDCPIAEGNSNFPNNPNVSLQGQQLVPPLLPGTTTFDGGSEGPFSLTKTSALSDLVIQAPTIGPPRDMMLGHALDSVFSLAPPPFGCQSGGGGVCAATGLKATTFGLKPDGSLAPEGPLVLSVQFGHENPISWAPHPNPPPLLATAPCTDPEILGQEPTSIDASLENLLAPGFSLGRPATCTPPTGLVGSIQNAFFFGPSPPSANPRNCGPFSYRQKIGHFLYVSEPSSDEIVVLDSNRFQVLERIAVEDPGKLAMSPNVDFLAVASPATESVVFIDIDPSSANFHSVVTATAVGGAPAGIAWQPDNEDILVCLEEAGSLVVLSAFTLGLRKRIDGLGAPFEVVATQRQDGFGFDRGVYFAYLLTRDGAVYVFESGPDSIGYDDVIGRLPYRLEGPTAMAIDPRALSGGAWVAGAGPTGTGIAGSFALAEAQPGPQPIAPGSEPNLRDLVFAIRQVVSPDELSGIPVDIAFDDLRNLGALPGVQSSFGAGAPAPINGKSLVRDVGVARVAVSQPSFLMLAVPTPKPGGGVVDVIELASAKRIDTDVFEPGVQSIAAAGTSLVVNYFRQ